MTSIAAIFLTMLPTLKVFLTGRTRTSSQNHEYFQGEYLRWSSAVVKLLSLRFTLILRVCQIAWVAWVVWFRKFVVRVSETFA